MMRSLGRAADKIRNKAAFTLAETLVAVLIMLMVSSVVAAGIPAARNAYEKVVLASNSEVLLSTTVTALRNELGTATDVKASGNAVTYYNAAYGSVSKIDLASASDTGVPAGTIMYEPYATSVEGVYDLDDTVNTSGNRIRLVSKEASDKNLDLYATYDAVSGPDDNGIITFTGLRVKKHNSGGDTDTPASLASYSIKLFAYQK